MATKTKVTIDDSGSINTHIASTFGEYATLCGMDGADPSIGQVTIPTPDGARIDCLQCFSIWENATDWKIHDFSPSVRGLAFVPARKRR